MQGKDSDGMVRMVNRKIRYHSFAFTVDLHVPNVES